MGKRLSSAAFGLGLLLLAACNAGKPAPPPSPPPRLAEVEKLLPGNNAFALDLYAKLARKEGNLFFSPLSVSAALAMTYAGASGQTAEQIARTCHFPEPDRLHEGFRNLLQTANAEGADLSERPYELRVANALWGQRGVAWREEFVNLTRRSYGAGLREVDFADSGKARAAINDWAAEQTSGRIPELLPDGLLNADTRMVLT
ncbi:MAG TPA: serpin family protein, partial [Gemmataceae bacterium]